MKKHSSISIIVSMVALGALALLLAGCGKSDSTPVNDPKAATGHPTTDPQYLNKIQSSGGGPPRSGGR